jgi:nucleotide-binding universal stress UspA family protein
MQPDLFERVVCGIDGSPESLEALRQVERLRPDEGALHLVTAAELSLAVHAGFGATALYDEIATDAEHALARAAELAENTTTRLVEGEPTGVLRREIDRVGATLVALGTHGHRRVAGIILGGTATTLLHEAPCSVLVAREPADPRAFPSSIVVGVDGSTAGLRAHRAAEEIGERLEVPLRTVAATGGKPVDFDGLRQLANGTSASRSTL